MNIEKSIENVLQDLIAVAPFPTGPMVLNTLRPRQNGRHFADDIFMCIFLNENVWIAIKISLKFVPKGPINNIPALVQTMAWRRPGDKPLSEPMMVSLLTHICVTRPQWVNWPGLAQPITPYLVTPHPAWSWEDSLVSKVVAYLLPNLCIWPHENLPLTVLKEFAISCWSFWKTLFDQWKDNQNI